MKKRLSALFALILGLMMAFSLVLVGCGKTPEGEGGGEGGGDPVGGQEEKFSVTYRRGYTPERFSDVSNEVTKLADGVYLVKNTMTLKKGAMNGKTSVVYTIEVDLAKANVVAGTKNNATTDFAWEKTAPYRTALAWEEATGGQVYASINADFFGSKTVNAFVKDGIIIKDSHNDTGVQGNYDYKNTSVDVPASAPMLFGVNGTKAQIAPIITVDGDPTTAAVKEQLVKAKLSYAIFDGNKTYSVMENTTPAELQSQTNAIAFHTSSDMVNPKNGYLVKVDTTKGLTALQVLEVTKLTGRTDVFVDEAGYAYLYSNTSSGSTYNYLGGLKVGDSISLSVASPDGKWNGYETILGCRQALVINNAVASTITLENTNGAQTQDIPRTAVGVKNGKVVLIAVESLFYYLNNDKINKNGYTINPETDFHGMSLPELAEFAYYYGCSDAANFDGGGSTQLVVRGEGETEARTVIRAAEYFTTGLFDTRVVVNSFLITSRVGK